MRMILCRWMCKKGRTVDDFLLNFECIFQDVFSSGSTVYGDKDAVLRVVPMFFLQYQFTVQL